MTKKLIFFLILPSMEDIMQQIIRLHKKFW